MIINNDHRYSERTARDFIEYQESKDPGQIASQIKTCQLHASEFEFNGQIDNILWLWTTMDLLLYSLFY